MLPSCLNALSGRAVLRPDLINLRMRVPPALALPRRPAAIPVLISGSRVGAAIVHTLRQPLIALPDTAAAHAL
jgi:hypothetical protein